MKRGNPSSDRDEERMPDLMGGIVGSVTYVAAISSVALGIFYGLGAGLISLLFAWIGFVALWISKKIDRLAAAQADWLDQRNSLQEPEIRK